MDLSNITKYVHNPVEAHSLLHLIIYNKICRNLPHAPRWTCILGCAICHMPWGASEAEIAEHKNKQKPGLLWFQRYPRWNWPVAGKGNNKPAPRDVPARGAVQIRLCKHIFHQTCFREQIQQDPKCPMCGTRMFGISEYGRHSLGADARFPVPFDFTLWNILPYNTLREACERIVQKIGVGKAQESSNPGDRAIPKGTQPEFNLDACYTDATRSKMLKLVVNMTRVHTRATILHGELIQLYDDVAAVHSLLAPASKDAAARLRAVATHCTRQVVGGADALRASMNRALRSGNTEELQPPKQPEKRTQLGLKVVFLAIEAAFALVGRFSSAGTSYMHHIELEEKEFDAWEEIERWSKESAVLSLEMARLE